MDLQQTRDGWRHHLGHEFDRCMTPGRGRARRMLRLAGSSLCMAVLAVGFPGAAHAEHQTAIRHGHPFTVVLAPPLLPPADPSPAAPAAPGVAPPEVASGAPPVPAGIAGSGTGSGAVGAVAQQAPPGDFSTPAGAGPVVASLALPGTGPRHLAELSWAALAAVSLGGALMVARRRRWHRPA